jgi:hypothetical protein
VTAVLEARGLAKTYETGGAKVLGLRGVDLSMSWPMSPPAISTRPPRGTCSGACAVRETAAKRCCS